jgi:gliding motility-associated-like protein
MTMIKYLTLFLLLVPCKQTHAQNLVLNPGFEAYGPPPPGGIVLLEDGIYSWASYFTTPDYFNTDIMGTSGVMSYCGTLPRSGNGMVGGYQLGYSPVLGYNREYIQGFLSEPLKPNTTYYTEMYVKPMLKSPFVNFGIKTLGIVVTDKHYTYNDVNRYMIEETPVVEYNTAPITDLTEWTKVSGCFMAKGGETKIIIGNFKKDLESDSLLLPGAFGEEQYHWGMSYFLFDDILVKEIPAAYILPGNATICRDSSLTLKAFPENGRSYKWNNGSAMPSLDIFAEGKYSVEITTSEGCFLEASTSIAMKYCGPGCLDLYMPNVFSPNGDGNNDFFKPVNPIDISGMDLSIYNRWGARIFYTSNKEGKWDGNYQQKPCETGTYFYDLNFRDCEGKSHIKKGDLTLIR